VISEDLLAVERENLLVKGIFIARILITMPLRLFVLLLQGDKDFFQDSRVKLLLGALF
jgi:hypothetical protein